MEILDFEFMQNAIISSFLISILCGIAGGFMVANRIVFLSGAIAHASYGGIGIAIFFGFSIFFGVFIFAVFMAVVVSYVLVYYKQRVDLFIGAFWSFGMALGIILIDLKGGYNSGFMDYFFGSILAISNDDIYYLTILSILILFLTVIFYNRFIAMAFDSEFIKLKGLNIFFHNIILVTICSFCVIMATKAVGLIMVMALFTIPIFISEMFANSFLKTIIYSSFISFVSMIIGLIVAYQTDLTPSATIIAILIVLFIIFYVSKNFYIKL